MFPHLGCCIFHVAHESHRALQEGGAVLGSAQFARGLMGHRRAQAAFEFSQALAAYRRPMLCSLLDASQTRTVGMPGGHHLGGDYDALAAQMLGVLPR